MTGLSYLLYLLPIARILLPIYQTLFELGGFDSFSDIMPPQAYVFLYVVIAIILVVGMISISLEST